MTTSMTVGTTAVRPVFAIFEGGGAKGLTHVGALKAMENAALEPIGVAGASAGAIVAALIAVGLRADDLFDPHGSDIFAANGASPVDLLGAADWTAFGRLQSRIGRYAAIGVVSLLPVIARLSWLARSPGIIQRFAREFGFFDSDSARDLLNRVLRQQLAPEYSTKGLKLPDLVRFSHLDPKVIDRFIRLKIVVTDLTTRSLVLFDQSTPDVVVADAVVASFSIPFFFRPAAVRGDGRGEERRYADGGLVSNLPLWVFTEEKRAVERDRGNHPPLPIVAMTLDDAPETVAPPVGFRAGIAAQLTNVVRSGIFGSQTVARAFVPDRFVVSLISPLAVLGFDMDRKTAVAGYYTGLEQATRTLQVDLRNRPDAARAALVKLLADARALSDRRRTDLGQPPLPQLRASIVAPLGDGFRVLVAAGMDDDADDRLVLDARAPGAPAAFKARDFVYVDVPKLGPADRVMTKYEVALVRPTLAAILAVPIFTDDDAWVASAADRPKPVGVLCIDSDAGLETEYDDHEFLQWLVEASVLMAPVVRDLGGTE